jgi:hypothetical protein
VRETITVQPSLYQVISDIKAARRSKLLVETYQLQANWNIWQRNDTLARIPYNQEYLNPLTEGIGDSAYQQWVRNVYNRYVWEYNTYLYNNK